MYPIRIMWYAVSGGLHSINNDTTTSFRLFLTPMFQNLAPTFTGIAIAVLRVYLYAHPLNAYEGAQTKMFLYLTKNVFPPLMNVSYINIIYLSFF